MPPIDLTNITYHALVERKNRYEQVKAVGIGAPLATTKEFNDGEVYYKTLTTTGIVFVRNAANTIITLYLAELSQAIGIFRTVYGNLNLPENTYNKILMNNIMFPTT